MPIITLYQGASGSGQEVAAAVADSLGYRSVGRELLVETAQRYGVPKAKLNEIIDRGPHWWERLLQDLRPYRIALQASFCELVQGANVVYHGHLGHEFLPGVTHVLKVLLTAPLQDRIQQVAARQKLSHSSARRYIEEVDQARSRRLMAMFGVDWRDNERYDLILNMGKLKVDGARRIIAEAARLEEYQPTTASRQVFQDISLTSRVHATLMASPSIRGAALDVHAEGGHVQVTGRIDHELLEQELLKLVEKVPGVVNVTTNLYVLPPFQEP
ncbi:MAG: cytidylate kinase family protein [Deltaproteobacteria bacterium]|nr:cytidylate kinase family protein [Deltaproteobacteria bacterium]